MNEQFQLPKNGRPGMEDENLYLVQHTVKGCPTCGSSRKTWVSFRLKSDSIYSALEWVKANVQETGVCVSRVDL